MRCPSPCRHPVLGVHFNMAVSRPPRHQAERLPAGGTCQLWWHFGASRKVHHGPSQFSYVIPCAMYARMTNETVPSPVAVIFGEWTRAVNIQDQPVELPLSSARSSCAVGD
jgi:hypothetical protein